MKYKLKAFLYGIAGLLLITAIAGFVNFFHLVVGTHAFLATFAALCVLYLCYVFGDLYLQMYEKKDKSDA